MLNWEIVNDDVIVARHKHLEYKIQIDDEKESILIFNHKQILHSDKNIDELKEYAEDHLSFGYRIGMLHEED